MTDVQLVDDSNGRVVGISEFGELYTAPISHSLSYYVKVDTAAQAFEIVPGIAGKKFVMTSMLISSSKTFGTATTAETITLYEGYKADLDTVVNTFTEIDLLKNDRLVATNLNLVSSTAISLIAIATDTDVNITIAGYYVPV